MPTLILDPAPPELERLREQRRLSGLDRMDEVWDGVVHMVPAPSHRHAHIGQQLAELLGPLARAAALQPTVNQFNLGESIEDFRVPDGGLHRPGAGGLWHPTAAMVVEIVSPGDESWQKLPFYASHGVDEVLIVNPEQQSVDWLALSRGSYAPVLRSALIAFGPAELRALLDWGQR
jgi:hypothetical protein